MSYKIYGKHWGTKELIADVDSYFMSGLYSTFKHYYKKHSHRYMEMIIEDSTGFEIFCKLSSCNTGSGKVVE